MDSEVKEGTVKGQTVWVVEEINLKACALILLTPIIRPDSTLNPACAAPFKPQTW